MFETEQDRYEKMLNQGRISARAIQPPPEPDKPERQGQGGIFTAINRLFDNIISWQDAARADAEQLKEYADELKANTDALQSRVDKLERSILVMEAREEARNSIKKVIVRDGTGKITGVRPAEPEDA